MMYRRALLAGALAAAAGLASAALVNAGFESTVPGKVGSPEEWWTVQHAGPGLKLHSVRGGYPIELIEMRRDAVHGTTDWARYEIALKVPAEAETLEVGLVLFGPGTVWIDDVALDVVADLPPRAEVESKGVAK